MLTFLFTDIADHTPLWEAHSGGMSVALAECERLLASSITAAGGRVVKRDGDAVMAVFEEPDGAVTAARAAQAELSGRRWPHVGELRVRMGLHVGEAEHRDGDYYGLTVIRAARLCACANGGQVVASSTVVAMTPGVPWVDLGEYRLKGLQKPERIYQLVDETQSFMPLRDVESTRDRVPRPRTSFIGRRDEVEQGVALIVSERLVTLTGVGGSGKTRLAIEIARAAIEHFSAGAVFVDLSVVTEPNQIDGAIAAAIGLDASQRGDESLRHRIREYFERRRALVLLDNCEHLLDACAELTDDLLEHCVEVAVLATSREPLRVDGERVQQVPSLPAEAAVQLFRARASVELPDDELVRRVCERLDHMPLAIELAAARCRHLPLAQLARRLDERFALLTGGRRHIQRQQTLQATLDWSFDLLSPSEAALFVRLAVFSGPFTIDAVEAVCRPNTSVPMDALAALVDCNLVDYLPAAERYWLLETTRLYAEQKLLASGETKAARDAHLRWYANLVLSLPGDEAFFPGASSRALVPDIENIRGALRWAAASDDWDTIGRLAPQLCGLWTLIDGAEGASWADRALGHLNDRDIRFGCIATWNQLRLLAPSTTQLPTSYSIGSVQQDRYTELIIRARHRTDGFAAFVQASTASDIYAAGRATGNDALCDLAHQMVRDALERARRPEVEAVWHGLIHIGAGYLELSAADVAAAAHSFSKALEMLKGTPTAHLVDLAAEFSLIMHLAGSADAIPAAQRALAGSPSDLGAVSAHCTLALEYAQQDDIRAATIELEHGAAGADRLPTHLKTQLLICAAIVAFQDGDTIRASIWLAIAVGHGGIFSTPAGVALYRTWVPQVRATLDHQTAVRLRTQGRSRTLGAGLREVVKWTARIDTE